MPPFPDDVFDDNEIWGDDDADFTMPIEEPDGETDGVIHDERLDGRDDDPAERIRREARERQQELEEQREEQEGFDSQFGPRPNTFSSSDVIGNNRTFNTESFVKNTLENNVVARTLSSSYEMQRDPYKALKNTAKGFDHRFAAMEASSRNTAIQQIVGVQANRLKEITSAYDEQMAFRSRQRMTKADEPESGSGFVVRPTSETYKNLASYEKDNPLTMRMTYYQVHERDTVLSLMNRRGSTEIVTQGYNYDYAATLDAEKQKVRMDVLLGNEATAAAFKAKYDTGLDQYGHRKTVDLVQTADAAVHVKTGYLADESGPASSKVNTPEVAWLSTGNITPTTAKNNTAEEMLLLKKEAGKEYRNRVLQEVKAATDALIQVQRETQAVMKTNRSTQIDFQATQADFRTRFEDTFRSLLTTRGIQPEGLTSVQDRSIFVNAEVQQQVAFALRDAAQSNQRVVLNIQYLEQLMSRSGSQMGKQYSALQQIRASIGFLAREGRVKIAISADSPSNGLGLSNLMDKYLNDKTLTSEGRNMLNLLFESQAFEMMPTGYQHSKSFAAFDEEGKMQSFGLMSANMSQRAASKNIESGIVLRREKSELTGRDKSLQSAYYDTNMLMDELEGDVGRYYQEVVGRGLWDNKKRATRRFGVEKRADYRMVERAARALQYTEAEMKLQGRKMSTSIRYKLPDDDYLRNVIGFGEEDVRRMQTGVNITVDAGYKRPAYNLSATIMSETMVGIDGITQDIPIVVLNDSGRTIVGSLFTNRTQRDITFGSEGSKRTVKAGETVELNAIETLQASMHTMSQALDFAQHQTIRDIYQERMGTTAGVGRASVDQVIAEEILRAASSGMIKDSQGKPRAFGVLGKETGGATTAEVINYLQKQNVRGVDLQEVIKAGVMRLTGPAQGMEKLTSSVWDKTGAETRAGNVIDMLDGLIGLAEGATPKLVGEQVDNLYQLMLADGSNMYDDLKYRALMNSEAARLEYEHRMRGASKELETRVFGAFKMPHELNYSYRQALHQRPAYAVSANLLDAWGVDMQPGSGPIHLGAAVINADMLQHASSLGQLGDYFRHVAGGTARGSSDVQNNLGGLFKTEGGPVIAQKTRELLRTLPGLDVITRDTQRASMQLMVDRGLMTQDQVDQQIEEIFFSEDAAGAAPDPALGVAYKYLLPYAKTEQMSQRLKNLQSQRPAIDVDAGLVRYIKTLGADPNGMPDQGHKYVAGNIKGVMPGESFAVFKQKMKETEEFYRSRGEDMSDPAVQQRIANEVTEFFRQSEVDPHQLNRGVIGGRSAKRVVMASGVGPMSDFGILNADYGDESERMLGSTQRMVLHARPDQLSNPLEVQAQIKDVLKAHQTIFVAKEYDLDQSVSDRLTEEMKAKVEYNLEHNIISNQQQRENITDTLNRMRLMENLVGKIGDYSHKLYMLSDESAGGELLARVRKGQKGYQDAANILAQIRTLPEDRQSELYTLIQELEAVQVYKRAVSQDAFERMTAQKQEVTSAIDNIIKVEANETYKRVLHSHENYKLAQGMRSTYKEMFKEMKAQHKADPKAVTQADLDDAKANMEKAYKHLMLPARRQAQQVKQTVVDHAINLRRAFIDGGYARMQDVQNKAQAEAKAKHDAQISAYIFHNKRRIMAEQGYAVPEDVPIDLAITQLVQRRAQLSKEEKDSRRQAPNQKDIISWMRQDYEHLDIKVSQVDGESRLTAQLKPGVYQIDPDDPLRPKKVGSYDGNNASATLDGIFVTDEQGRKQPMTIHASAFSKREEGAVTMIADDVTTTYEGGRITVDATAVTVSEFRSGMRVTGGAKGPMVGAERKHFDQVESVLDKNRYGKGISHKEMLPQRMQSQDLFAVMATGQFKQFPTEAGLLMLEDVQKRPGIMRLIDDGDAGFGGGRSVALGLMFMVGAGVEQSGIDSSSYKDLKTMDPDLFRQLERGAFSENLARAFGEVGWKTASAAIKANELGGLMKMKDTGNLVDYMGPLEALVLDGRQNVTIGGTGQVYKESLAEGLRRTVATAFATDAQGQFTKEAMRAQKFLQDKTLNMFDSLRSEANTMAYKLRTGEGGRWVLSEQSPLARGAGALALNMFMGQQVMSEGSLLDDPTNKALIELNLNVDGVKKRFADDPVVRQQFVESMKAFEGTDAHRDIMRQMAEVELSASKSKKDYGKIDYNLNKIQQKADELFAMRDEMLSRKQGTYQDHKDVQRTLLYGVNDMARTVDRAVSQMQVLQGGIHDGTNQPKDVTLALHEARNLIEHANKVLHAMTAQGGLTPEVSRAAKRLSGDLASAMNVLHSVAPRAGLEGDVGANEISALSRRIQDIQKTTTQLKAWAGADNTTYDKVLNEKTARKGSADRFIYEREFQHAVRSMALAMDIPLRGTTVEEFQNMSQKEQEEFRRETEQHLSFMYKTTQANKMIELPVDITLSQALVPTGMQDMTSMEFHYVHAMMKNQFSIYGVGQKVQKDLVDLQTAVMTVGRFLNPNPRGVPLMGEWRRMLGGSQLGMLNVPFASEGNEYGKASVLASMIASSGDQVTMNEGVSTSGYQSPIQEVVSDYITRGLDDTKKGSAMQKLKDIQTIMTEKDLARPGSVDPDTGVSRDVQKRVEAMQRMGLDEQIQKAFKLKDVSGDDVLDVKRLKEFTKMESQEVVNRLKQTAEDYKDFIQERAKQASAAAMQGDKRLAKKLGKEALYSFEEYVDKTVIDADYLKLFTNDKGGLIQFYDQTGATKSVVTQESQADAVIRVKRMQRMTQRVEEAVDLSQKRTYGKQWLEAMRHAYDRAELQTRVIETEIQDAIAQKKAKTEIDQLRREKSRSMSLQAALGVTTAVAMPAYEKQMMADGTVGVRLLSTYYDKPIMGVQLGLDVMQKMSMLFPDHTSEVLRTQMEMRSIQGRLEQRGTMAKLRDGFGGATLDAEEMHDLERYSKLLYQSRDDLIKLSQTQVIRQTKSDKMKARGATFVATSSWLVRPDEVGVGKRITRAAGMSFGGGTDLGFGRYLQTHLKAVATSKGKTRNAYLDMLSGTLRQFAVDFDDAMSWGEANDKSYTGTKDKRLFGRHHIIRILGKHTRDKKLNVEAATREIVDIFLGGKLTSATSTTEAVTKLEERMYLSTAMANRTGSPAMAAVDTSALTVDIKSMKDLKDRAKNEGTSLIMSEREASTLMLLSATGHQFSQLGDYDGDTYQTVLTEVSRRTNEITDAIERFEEIDGRMRGPGMSTRERKLLMAQRNEALEDVQRMQHELEVAKLRKRDIEKQVDMNREKATKKFVSTYVGLPEFMTDAFDLPMQAAHMVKFYRDTQSSLYDHGSAVAEQHDILQKMLKTTDLSFQKGPDDKYTLNVSGLTNKQHDVVSAAFGEMTAEELEDMDGNAIMEHYTSQASRMVNVVAAMKGITKLNKNATGQSLTAEQFGAVTTTIGQIGTELLGKTYDTIIPLAKGTGVKLAMARAMRGANAPEIQTQMMANLETMRQREIASANRDADKIDEINERYDTTQMAFERAYGTDAADATQRMDAYAAKLEQRAQSSARFLGDLQQMMRDAIKAKEGTNLTETMAKFEYQDPELAGGRRMVGLDSMLTEIGAMTDLSDNERLGHQMGVLRKFIGEEMGPELGKYLGTDPTGKAIRDNAGVNMQAFGVMYLLSDYASSRASMETMLESESPFWKQLKDLRMDDKYKGMSADDFVESVLVDLSTRAQANFIVGAMDFNDSSNAVFADSLKRGYDRLVELQEETQIKLDSLQQGTDDYNATLKRQQVLTEYAKVMAPAAGGMDNTDANTMHKVMSDIIFTNMMQGGGAIGKEQIRYMRTFGLAFQDAKKMNDAEGRAAKHGGELALAATALALQRGKFDDEVMMDLAIESNRTLMQDVSYDDVPGFRDSNELPYDQAVAEMDRLAALRGWETGGEFDVIDEMNLTDAEKLEAKRRMMAAMAMTPEEEGKEAVFDQMRKEMEGLQFVAGRRHEATEQMRLSQELYAQGDVAGAQQLQSDAERINQEIVQYNEARDRAGAFGASQIVELGEFFDSDFVKDISGVNATLSALQKRGTQMAQQRQTMRRRHEGFEVAGLLAGPMMMWMAQEDTGLQPDRVAAAGIDLLQGMPMMSQFEGTTSAQVAGQAQQSLQQGGPTVQDSTQKFAMMMQYKRVQENFRYSETLAEGVLGAAKQELTVMATMAVAGNVSAGLRASKIGQSAAGATAAGAAAEVIGTTLAMGLGRIMGNAQKRAVEKAVKDDIDNMMQSFVAYAAGVAEQALLRQIEESSYDATDAETDEALETDIQVSAAMTESDEYDLGIKVIDNEEYNELAIAFEYA